MESTIFADDKIFYLQLQTTLSIYLVDGSVLRHPHFYSMVDSKSGSFFCLSKKNGVILQPIYNTDTKRG
jgi:hypothetical protein